MASGIPVVISGNGRGMAVNPVSGNAPLMTVAENGRGTPIVISSLGSPFVVDGYDPEEFWDWQTFDLTNGDGDQWVGYSDGGATRPQPAFGSISAQPTSRTTLLALYDDTASGVVLAVFAGNYVSQLEGLQISIGGFVLESFEVELIGGNTWVRFDDMPGVWTPGDVYQVLFGFDLIQGPFPVTNSILGAGGLDYALYDSSALDRMWQESTGQTAAALASPVGLIVGREDQAAKTFAQVMAGQPELRGTGVIRNDGTPPSLGSYDTGTGAGSVSRGASLADQSVIRFEGLSAAKAYIFDVENVSGVGSLTVRSNTGSTTILILAPGQRSVGQAVPVLASYLSVQMQGNNGSSSFIVHSVKEVPAHYASQASTGARPVLQSDGLKFDGSDDNLLTDWFAQAGANCIIAQVVVPAAIAANQVIAGSQEVNGRWWVGISTAGKLRIGIGDSFFEVGNGADLRGTSAIVAISSNGTVRRIYENANTLEAGTAQTGSANTARALRIGALDNNGSLAAYFGGNTKKLALAKVDISDTQFQQIRAEWLAAA